ncbi:MAG: glycolate oxidase subunit GlcE [Rhodobacteraceae bacterium]|nr:glycolate oxidase subunit GlcE [Paracoccaceae bacterium]
MTPTSEKDLAELVAVAKNPLEIIGGGSRKGLGNAVSGDALHTSGLSGITLYDPGALTLVAQSGTPLAEIETALAAENQMLPFEPMSHAIVLGNDNTPTVGGMVATNASGPRRIKAGACRDSLIGVRYVDGHGQVIKNGGRVMKNVTGYDLVKLMAGAHGTLGVLTEVAFKLLPSPETQATLRFELPLKDGLQKLRDVMASPYDVSGVAYRDGVAFVRVEGFEDSVKYRAKKIGGDVITANIWPEIRDAINVKGDVIWRLSVKPSDAFAVASQLAEQGFETPLFDWSGGLIWVTSGDGSDAPRQTVNKFGGHATLIKGDGHPAFHPEPAILASIATGLRAKFDPRGIFNQGRMA